MGESFETSQSCHPRKCASAYLWPSIPTLAFHNWVPALRFAAAGMTAQVLEI